ncbi:MAG TPA: hypothetical protein VFG38_11105 [Pseudomonadales bacterium]|nr:hypothetical protein [Pseudomonadales bacterium]
MTALDCFDLRQQLHAEIRREDHRDDPRHDEREADHPENVAGVFAGGRTRETDRQESGDRHECSGEHRRRRVTPRIGGRRDAVHTFLHFHHHHLDGDDRVVYEEPEREDERPERDAIEEPVGLQHDEEHDGKRQRDGRCHDDAHAPAETDQAHQQDHAERHRELHHELVDRCGDVDGLIAHLFQRHPERQGLRDVCRSAFQRLAEGKTVPALLHDGPEHDDGLTLMPDEVSRGICVAAADLGDVGEFQRPPPGDERSVGDCLDIVIRAVDSDEDPRPASVDRAGRCHGVLSLQGGNDVLRRHAERCQLGVGKLDEYLFGTFTENVDLLDAGHVQQVLTDRLGLPHQFAHRHTLRLEGIQGKAHVRVFVVDERAEHAGRQVPRFVRELLARLVELVLHDRRRRTVLQRDRHVRVTRSSRRLHPVVPVQLLKALLQRLCDEVLHLARCRTGPSRRHRQILEGESRILRAPEHDERVSAGSQQQKDEEQRDGTLANGDCRKIESHQTPPLPEPVLTRAPSCSR